MDVPDVSYARSGDVAIAYQAVGEGPPDLVLLPFLANIYTLWLAPRFAEIGRRLATRRRLVVVNPRGAGLSDRPRGVTVESRMDDIRAARGPRRQRRCAHLGGGRRGRGARLRNGEDLVAGSGIAFEDRGVRELKGLPGEWRIYSVVDD